MYGFEDVSLAGEPNEKSLLIISIRQLIISKYRSKHFLGCCAAVLWGAVTPGRKYYSGRYANTYEDKTQPFNENGAFGSQTVSDILAGLKETCLLTAIRVE